MVFIPEVCVICLVAIATVYAQYTPTNTRPCAENEQRAQCGTACEPTCTNSNPVCTRQCIPNVCRCQQGYVRNSNNRCILQRNCPRDPYNPCASTTCPVGSQCRNNQVQCVRAPCYPVAECYTPQNNQCGPNETYRNCSSNCERSCSNKNPVCNQSCGPPRCQCRNGLYRDANRRCVNEAQCGDDDFCFYSVLYFGSFWFCF
ncbi:trypsin Inhibitor like cysteine rich domain protein [Dictyocaulus viviparus]|uniref:Trypsin Inhibitor like cysteine rich domain protein n=1 Tax=Dictyocaulus viviparus TaxID=29172 RepID=A0A0D8Y0H7_DICVI|nr:trypsin Inhibitor like cysteine rich domain protein [Dictyocaulus viviparus]